jgi:hypothetical protein
MQGIVRGAGIDLSDLILDLSDEDVRYTTDVKLGFYNAVLCALYAGKNVSSLVIWELFASPGMDMLCKMLMGSLHPEMRMDITAVSAARDDVEHDRFRRMMANERSLTACLHSENISVRYVPSLVSEFCQEDAADHGTRPKPDVISMSPPWMISDGDMHGAWHDNVSPVGTFVRLMGGIAGALGSRGPTVYSVMLPYSWDEFKPVLEHMPGYTLAESVTIQKNNGHNAKTSSYHVHYMVRGYTDTEKQSQFVFDSHNTVKKRHSYVAGKGDLTPLWQPWSRCSLQYTWACQTQGPFSFWHLSNLRSRPCTTIARRR